VPALYLPFVLTAAFITVVPGPDMALALRNAARGGSAAVWRTGLGCCLGICVHATLAIAGLSAVLAVSRTAFDVVRYAGAAYLAYLGVRALLPHARPTTGMAPGPTGSELRQGVLSNLLNPKVALLFLTLLPQFVSDGEPRLRTTTILAATFLVMAVVWWRTFSLAIDVLAPVLTRPAVALWLERLTGVVLVALAVRVALVR
jgi:threonine/homoserine/homoserine lactone efflux protein